MASYDELKAHIILDGEELLKHDPSALMCLHDGEYLARPSEGWEVSSEDGSFSGIGDRGRTVAIFGDLWIPTVRRKE